MAGTYAVVAVLEVVLVVPEVVESEPDQSDFSSSLQPVATAAPAQSTAGAQTRKRSEAICKIAGSGFKGGSSKDEARAHPFGTSRVFWFDAS